MTDLTEYLDPPTLQELANSFSAAADSPVWILSADGRCLAGVTPRTVPAGPEVRRSVRVGGQEVGAVCLGRPPEDADATRLAALMQDVVTRLCAQSAQLRDRVEELAAVYKLTEEFSARADLQQVHQLVAQTMVKVTGAAACSIRVAKDDGAELAIVAACGLSDSYMAKGRLWLVDSKIDQEIFNTGQTIYIADERTDPRILYKAEAQREGIVSALCVPMSYRGKVEGVIRVYTKRPHVFDWYETSLIRGIAAQAASAIVNARLAGEKLQAETMRHQVQMAGEVQRRMIPREPPKLPGLDIAALYVPCFELGGDFYDFIELPSGNLGLAVADVAGKGVRASLLMASAKAALRAHAAHIYELALVLASVNVQVWRDGGGDEFVTMFYGVLDLPNKRLTYCNAGHEPALLVRDGLVRSLSSVGGVLGIDPNMRFEHETLDLRSGDALLMFTDGLPEAINFREEMFGRERVRAAVLAAVARGESAEGIGKHLLWEMRRFSGLQNRGDDLTLVTVKVQ